MTTKTTAPVITRKEYASWCTDRAAADLDADRIDAYNVARDAALMSAAVKATGDAALIAA